MERKSFYKKQTHQRLAAAILLWLGCCVLAFSQNTVTLTGGEGKPGGQISVSLGLKNADALSAMQVDIPLDESLTFVEGSERIDRERLGDHEIKVSRTENGIRVLLYSLSLKTMQAGEGRLLTFDLKLKRAPGTYTLSPQVTLTGSKGEVLPCENVAADVVIRAARMEEATTSVDFGKVPVAASYERHIEVRNTGNETMKISEISFSDSCLTGTATPVFIEGGKTEQIKVKFSPHKKGSYNGSISLMSDALDGIQTIQVKAELYTVNELHMEPASGVCDEIVTVAVKLKNTEEVSAVQFALELPEELEYIQGSEQATASSHKANGTYKDGRLTMMVYSLSDAALACGDTELLSFKIRLKGESGVYDLTPSDVRIGNMQLENVCSAYYGTKVSISSPRMVYDDSFSVGNVDMTLGTTVSYTVQNVGSSALIIDKITFMDDRFEVMTALPLEINKGNKETLQIKMAPSAEEGDLSTMMNIYSNNPEAKMAAVNLKGKVYAPNTISLLCYPSVTDNESRLDVCMQNKSDITAFQMDIICPEEVQLTTENIILGDRMGGHQLYCSQLEDGTYRISGFSLSNKPIDGENGVLFSFNIYDTNDVYRIENIKLSDVNGVNKYTGNIVCLEWSSNHNMDLVLPAGWNWISCNLVNLSQVSDFIQPITDKIEQFVGFDAELVRDAKLGLVGQLKTIVPGACYQIKTNAEIDCTWMGKAFVPEEVAIALKKGWNWIGYIPTSEMTLEDALKNLTPAEGDMVKSYTDFSTYSNGKWTGTLSSMTPGQGYMYYSGKETSFYYPSDAVKDPMKSQAAFSEEDKNAMWGIPWQVAKHKYPNNMCLIAEVQGHTSRPLIVGAFVGEECRGVGKYVDGKIFITIYGNTHSSGEIITFKAFDMENRREFLLAEACELNEAKKGTLQSPFLLTPVLHTDIATGTLPNHFRISMDQEQETLMIKSASESEITKAYMSTPQGIIVAESQPEKRNVMDLTHMEKGLYVVVVHTTDGVFVKKVQKTK